MRKAIAIIFVMALILSQVSIAQESETTYARYTSIGQAGGNIFTNIWNVITGKALPSGQGVFFDILLPDMGGDLAGQDYHRGNTLYYESRLRTTANCGGFAQVPWWYTDIYNPSGQKIATIDSKIGESIVKDSTYFADFQWTIPTNAAFGRYTIKDVMSCKTLLGVQTISAASTNGYFDVVDCSPWPAGSKINYCNDPAFRNGGSVLTINNDCSSTSTATLTCSNTQKCSGPTDLLLATPPVTCVPKCQGVTCNAVSVTCPDGFTASLTNSCDQATGKCTAETSAAYCTRTNHNGPNDPCYTWQGSTRVLKDCGTQSGFCNGDGLAITCKKTCSNGQCQTCSIADACNAAGRGTCTPNPPTYSVNCPTLGGGTESKTCSNSCTFGKTGDCRNTAAGQCSNPCLGQNPGQQQTTCPNGETVSCSNTCNAATGQISQCTPTCSECQNQVCGDGTCGSCESESSCGADCTVSGCAKAVCGDSLCTAGCEEVSTCGVDCDLCGNGMCDSGETCTSCPKDCDPTGTSCLTCPQYNVGDGKCDKSGSITVPSGCAAVEEPCSSVDCSSLPECAVPPADCSADTDCWSTCGTTGVCASGKCDFPVACPPPKCNNNNKCEATLGENKDNCNDCVVPPSKSFFTVLINAIKGNGMVAAGAVFVVALLAFVGISQLVKARQVQKKTHRRRR